MAAKMTIYNDEHNPDTSSLNEISGDIQVLS